ncbi:hypothetical protein CFAM422_011237 [Trichoderma lentiforme]|uniref:Steroid 5-alpha reductase C-terminal domain-containing protein n=1 Tax=Trichoderma lentiforme TaxID=1567552 RepID=A0A9P4X743_9HYPO|nr:hypothetical protein CFAM422_011237 [Trichoderma lentiforme]
MPAIHVLDDYYLAITAFITVSYQLFFVAIAYTCNFDKLTDLAGGSNFIILAITTLSLNHHHQTHQLVTTFFLITWAIRLTTFLLSASSKQANMTASTRCAKTTYMIAVSPAADGFVHGQAYKALYATILDPFFLTFLLLFVSGMPLSERPKAKARYESNNNWQAYKRWLDHTSILIPFPPQLYEKMPKILKRTIFLELPMYVFDPKKHSDMSQPGGAADEDDVGPGGDDRGSTPQSGEERLI